MVWVWGEYHRWKALSNDLENLDNCSKHISVARACRFVFLRSKQGGRHLCSIIAIAFLGCSYDSYPQCIIVYHRVTIVHCSKELVEVSSTPDSTITLERPSSLVPQRCHGFARLIERDTGELLCVLHLAETG